ncbi:MAG: sterol desaturase family protein, partial [Pseudomonadota bacterium]
LGFMLLGFCVLLPLERLIPRHRMKVFRPQWMTDLFHVFMTSFLSVLPLIVIFPLLAPLRSDTLMAWVQAMPQWLQIVAALFITEFLIYWGHRLSHTIPLLWRFHAVHHSIEHLDWIAGERRHPIDGLLMAFFVGIPLLIAGFDLIDLLWVGLFNSLWDTTIHANLGWRLKFMDRIWVSTEYHHWHHSADLAARDTNFAGALPIWDILFGTYYLPSDRSPGPYGIDTHMPETYLGQLLQPFRPMQSKQP